MKRWRGWLIGLGVLLGVGPAQAQILTAPTADGQGERSRVAVFAHPVFPDTTAAPTAAAQGRTYRVVTTSSATFEVTYDGVPEEAKAPIEYALEIWAAHLTTTVPIRVSIAWAPLQGTNVLGTAGPRIIRDWDGAPRAGVWYPYALADALARRDLQPGEPDIEATFNSNVDTWSLCPEFDAPAGTYSLLTAALHEFGHGLGILGALTVFRQGNQTVADYLEAGGVRYPFVYDRFTEDADGLSLQTGYTRPSSLLALTLQSDGVFFTGPRVRQYVPARKLPLYAPSTWRQGTSYSHLDEDAFPRGNLDALMSPFLVTGEQIETPGQATCALLREMGWSPGPGCQQLLTDARPYEVPAPETCVVLPPVGSPQPPDDYDPGYRLHVLSDTQPFASVTRLVLTVKREQRVQVALYDALGRHVRDLETLDLRSRGSAVLSVDTSGLPTGLYIVRILGERFVAGQALPVVR